MKKNITILVALFIAFNASAQSTEQMMNDRMERLTSQYQDDAVASRVFEQAEDMFLNDSTLWYDFASETDSTPYSRYDNTFDANGTRTLGLSSKWDDTQNDWVGDEKDVYVYEAGEYITYIFAAFDANLNEYVNDYKKVYTNNDAGYAAVALYYEWDASGNDWKSTPYQKKEYLYDTYNNLIEENYFEATGVDEYEPTKQYQNTFDVDGNKTNKYYVKWDTDAQDWYNYKDYSWVYESGLLIEYYYNKYDSDAGSFYEYKKETFENDANGNQIKHTYLKYDSDISDYYETDKYDYVLDENGNKILSNQFEYDDEWVFVSRGFYTYSKLAIGVNLTQNNSQSFSFYPNPANDFIQIELNGASTGNLYVYSISGQLLIEKSISNSTNKLELSSFPSGVYFIKVDNGITAQSKKLIIE